jgi:hypothetical protein
MKKGKCATDAVCYEGGADEPSIKGGTGSWRVHPEQDLNEDGVRVCDDCYRDLRGTITKTLVCAKKYSRLPRNFAQ